MTNLLLYFFAFLLEAATIFFYAKMVFVSKTSLKINIVVLMGLYFILFFISTFAIFALNALAFFLCNLIYFYFIYTENWKQSIFHSVLATATMAISELLTSGFIEYLSPGFYQNLTATENLLALLISKIMYLFILYLFALGIQKRTHGIQHQNNQLILLCAFPITSCAVTITFVYLCTSTSISESINLAIIISSVMLFITNLLVYGLFLYNQKRSYDYTQLQLALQNESDTIDYYKMLSTQTENQNILIHDIKKHLQSLEQLNLQGKSDVIASYIETLLKSSSLKSSIRVCDNDTLNSILNRYQQLCDEKHIQLNMDIRSKTVDFMDSNDITSLFCNMLDNSVEAAEICTGFIELNIDKKENLPLIVITLVNSCRTDPFPKNGGTLTTSKPDHLHHGYGVRSIERIVKQYHGKIEMYFDQDTYTFHTVIAFRI